MSVLDNQGVQGALLFCGSLAVFPFGRYYLRWRAAYRRREGYSRPAREMAQIIEPISLYTMALLGMFFGITMVWAYLTNQGDIFSHATASSPVKPFAGRPLPEARTSSP